MIIVWCFAGRFVYGISDHTKWNVPKAECYNTPVNGHDAEPLGLNFHPHGSFREDPASQTIIRTLSSRPSNVLLSET